MLLTTATGSSFWAVSLQESVQELPAQTCNEAMDNGVDYQQGMDVPPDAPSPLPMPKVPEILSKGKMPRIYKNGARVKPPVEYLPHLLPLQPLEGAPRDIARIGQAMRDAAGGARVRFTFFGASHTGGDYWTGHIRRVLQTRYGDIGHGFTMPVPLYSSARANDINLCSSEGWTRDYVGRQDGHGDGMLGLGMAVSSSDPMEFAWLETTHQNPIGRNAAFYEILTLSQPEGGGMTATVDRQEPVLIPTYSDEPYLQHTRLEVMEGPHRLTLSPAGDGEARLFGVSAELPGAGVLVDAIGIRGREARTWLRWNEEIFTAALNSLAPDVLVLAYGTNEANFVDYKMENYDADLRKVLELMRRAQPEAGCILVGPSDRGKSYKRGYRIWERTAMVAEVQRNVAPDFGCVFWDWQLATGGEGSMIAWRQTDPPLAAGDLIHHTAAGYVHVAERFIEALDDAAENY